MLLGTECSRQSVAAIGPSYPSLHPVLCGRRHSDHPQSVFEITISMRYAELAVPIFGSKAILNRTMPAWCLLNASGHGYRALTSLCCPRQPVEIADSNRLSG